MEREAVMDKKTAEMISKFLTDEGLAPDHVQYAAERKFSDEAMEEVSKRCGLSDLEAKELASTIKGMREGTQRVALPAAVTAPTDDGAEVPETPESKPLTRKDLTELFMAGIILLIALLGVLLMVHSCDSRKSLDGLKKDVASVKTDVADIKTNMPSKADIDTIKGAVTAKSSLGTTVTVMDVVRDIRTTTVKLADLDVLAHKDDLSNLATKDDMSNLVKTDDLSGLATTRHLRRVERKLDAHIAAEENAPVAEAEEEPTPVAPGTITVIVPPEE